MRHENCVLYLTPYSSYVWISFAFSSCIKCNSAYFRQNELVHTCHHLLERLWVQNQSWTFFFFNSRTANLFWDRGLWIWHLALWDKDDISLCDLWEEDLWSEPRAKDVILYRKNIKYRQASCCSGDVFLVLPLVDPQVSHLFYHTPQWKEGSRDSVVAMTLGCRPGDTVRSWAQFFKQGVIKKHKN